MIEKSIKSNMYVQGALLNVKAITHTPTWCSMNTACTQLILMLDTPDKSWHRLDPSRAVSSRGRNCPFGISGKIRYLGGTWIANIVAEAP